LDIIIIINRLKIERRSNHYNNHALMIIFQMSDTTFEISFEIITSNSYQ